MKAQRTMWILIMVGALMGMVGEALAKAPAVSCQVALDREVLLAETTQKTVLKITLDAPVVPRETERPPVNLAIVLDRSGSMAGSKIRKAREAALEALHRLGPDDIFSLVVYDHQVQTLVAAQKAKNTEWIEAQIRSIAPGGNTALFAAVSQGAAEVRKHVEGDYVHRVVLLSDGLANVGPSSPGDLARLGAALLKEGISVTTIGIGNDFNEDLMVQLAGRSDGNHYFVEASRDLPRIFAAELGDVLSVVARKVLIEIECPKGVRPVRIIGREGRIRGNRVGIQMNQLYGGQDKYALVEVEVPASKPESWVELAKVRCLYEDALTSRKEKTTVAVKARTSSSVAAVRKGANKAVNKAVVENEMATARDEALDLYNQGKKEEAASSLRQKSQALKERGDALGLPAAAAQAEVLEEEAETFSGEGLSAPQKKKLRSESYRVRRQQKAY